MGIEPGQIIEGKYRVLRRIGEGGMGTVYEGENVRIERRVAIKVLHAHVAEMAEFAQRFEREARASARIGSPHVCDVLDLGDLPNGERYIVMEYLDGVSLEDRLAETALTPTELAPIAFDILEGLGTMHDAGVIHRDLKPANIFLAKHPNRRGEAVKILDFGVAKIIPRVDETGNMTSTGMVMGTPLYMSPEQARGARDVDSRADIYSASVIFYRALTGELPYTAENLHELIYKIAVEDPRPIKDAAFDIDEEFGAIVMKGLARDPAGRHPSARAYQEAIGVWGRAQGRASLAFALTMSSARPARLSAVSVAVRAGSQPALPVAAVTPAAMTPAGGTIKNEEADVLAPSPLRPRSGAKTPTAWSELTPIALAPSEVSTLDELPKSAHVPIAPLAPPPPPSSSPLKRIAIVGVIAVAAIAGVSVFAFRGSKATEAGKGIHSAALADSAPAATSITIGSEVPPPAPVPLPVAETSASASSAKSPIVPTKAPVAKTQAVTAHASASAPLPLPATVTASAAPAPTPAATTSSGRRKFRTDL